MSTSRTESIEGARAVLRDLPLLALMPPDARRLVEGSFVPVRFPFGAVMVREGDDADAFYVLVAGTARVVKSTDQGDEVPLNVLRPGDAFGELALLEQSTRTATVRASSEVQALRLDRSIFQALAADNPEIREHLDVLVHRHHLRDFLRLHTFFARLPGDALATMLAELRPVHVYAGEIVVRQGDPPGSMYLVQDGRLRVSQEDRGEVAELAYLRTGDVFGEIALFTGRPRQATVEAVSECTLLELGQETFRRLVDNHPQFRERIAERVSQWDYRRLARVPIDFGQELLPVEAEARDKVGLDQVDEVHDDGGISVAQAVTEPEPAPQVPSTRRLRRFPQVWQIDEQDCGAACVAMVCRHFGSGVSLARIREAVHTGVEGTSLLGIARGAETLGLAARTVKASKSRLDDLPLPAVVHWEGNHWVVLYDLDGQRARVADPARGLRRLSRDAFAASWSGYAALLRPTPTLARGVERRATLPWLADALRAHRTALLRVFTLAVVAAILQMLIAVFAQVIVDRVVERDDPDLLTILVPLMGAVMVLAMLATVLQRRLLSSAAVGIDGSVLDALTRRLLALPMSYFIARRGGDIERRLAGVRQVRQLLLSDGVNGVAAALQLVLALGLMLVYSWRLALVYLAVMPVYAALVRFGARRVRPMSDSIEESLGRYQARQVEAIRGIETVKATNAEAGLRRVMRGQFEEVADRLRRAHRATLVYEGAIQAVPFLSLALFLWIGALEVLAHRLTLGELVAFNALVLLGNAAVVTLLVLVERLQQAGVVLDRLSDVLEQEPERPDASNPVPTLEGRITAENVGFHYGGPAAVPVLEDITFEVAPGTTVGIVGRSGSGKTTLAKCLAGLLDPTGGRILYDGVDGRSLDRGQLRRHIGFVLQESHLFDDTIAGNIALGEENPDVERVMWAARLASAHEFVQRLPLGYDTRVGDSGLLLSAGQRQRIAIARAVYNRPSMLILDEATSFLDTESERAVQDNLGRLLHGRTGFVIAPRPAAARDADLILVLEKGRIVEQGTHEELMARQGLYYYLSSQQLDR